MTPSLHVRSYRAQVKETHNRARTGIALRADWDTVRRAEVQQKLAAIAPGYVEQALTPLASLGVLELADGDRVLSQEVTALLIALRIRATRAAAPVALVGTQARSQPAGSLKDPFIPRTGRAGSPGRRAA